MSAAQPVPVNWHDLSARASVEVATVLNHCAKVSNSLQEMDGNDLLSVFAGMDSVVARSCILNGSRASRATFERYLASLSRVRRAIDSVGATKRAIAWQIENFALVAECAGMTGPAKTDAGLFKPLVAVRKTFSDSRRRSIAFTALALRDTTSALALVDAKPAEYDEPRLAFEFNIFELIRYLASAIDERRPADWVEPAWLEYLNLFPLHLAADAAAWPDLFMFARVLAALRGDKISDIADDLHARVQRLAQET
jgi:hypothetical protein